MVKENAYYSYNVQSLPKGCQQCVRGEKLVFEGPLGLSGKAIHLVQDFSFEAVEGGRTRIRLVVQGSGVVEKGWPEAIDRTWRHFLVEQFLPWASAAEEEQKRSARRGEATSSGGRQPSN